MSRFNHPNNSDKLIPHIIDELAQTHPEKLYGETPISPETYEHGYRKITYRDLANAINGMTHWIEKTLGLGSAFGTLVYLGPHDVRYVILLVAAVKAGYKMLFPSTRFATVAVVDLINKVDGKAMLVPKSAPPIVGGILNSRPMPQYQIPEINELLDNEHPGMVYERIFEDALNQPLIALHTSGSTGFPKPIIWTHDWANSFAKHLYLDPPEGYESATDLMLNKRMLSLFPQFHAAHLLISLLFPIYTGTVIVYPIVDQPPSIHVALEALRRTQIDIACLIPPMLGQLGSDPALLEEFANHVRYITWGGGDIGDKPGNQISSKIQLFDSIGGTEMGLWPAIRRKDWKSNQWHYVQFHPAMNISMEHRERDIYEAVVKRNSLENEQPVFKIFKHTDEYATGDLFIPHPNIPELWKYYGRADDMLVFRSGEKFHPVDVEHFLIQHKEIEDALLIGTGKPQGALLLKLAPRVELEHIWPTIEEMNTRCPAYARVSRDRLLLVHSDKPIVKTGKGTIQRKVTEDLYREELNKLFDESRGNKATQ